MNFGDLREHVVRPALQMLDLWSPVAEDLVLGTAAQESRGEYLEQLHAGPALGIFQMEPATFRDIWINFLPSEPRIRNSLLKMVVNEPNAIEMAWNLRFAAGMCRVHYFRKKEPLPMISDPALLAGYWKRHYNTALGSGTQAEFIYNYKKFVQGVSEID